jgi:hypothetical protein
MNRSSVLFILLATLLALPFDGENHSTIVCLSVKGVEGIYCVEGADAIGDCLSVDQEKMICVADPADMAVRISTYDPAMGGTNCDGDCGHTATRPVTPDMYEWAAACPAGWTTRGETTIVHFQFRDVWCVDRGGAVHPTWREVYTPEGFRQMWVIVIDIMEANPENHWWSYSTIPAGEWSLGHGLPPSD